MIYTTKDYYRDIDINDTVLIFNFDDRLKELISNKVEFETEDGGAAPEPSLGCRVRNHIDIEFALTYLLASKRLLVTGELNVDKHILVQQFLDDFPELVPYLIYNELLENDSSNGDGESHPV